MSRLISRTLTIESLHATIRERMFHLMSASYDHIDRVQFFKDLSWKDEVILLEDAHGKIQGFTTLAFNPKGLADPRGDVLFSGDTIINPAHWGGSELVRAFCHRAGEWRLRNGRPLFWMLISKGHRTYLFLSLYAKRFFPHPSSPESTWEQIANSTAKHLFGAAWNPNRGIIAFDTPLGQLKPTLAATSHNRRGIMAKYFLEKNPGFAEGDELVCLTKLDTNNLKRAALKGFISGATPNYIHA